MNSNINNYTLFSLANFEKHEFKEFQDVKKFLEDKVAKGFSIFDTLGNIYKKDNIENLESVSDNQKFQAVIYTKEQLGISMVGEIINLEVKTENEGDTEKILTDFLKAKSQKLSESYEGCREIKEKCEKFKQNDENYKKFEESDIGGQNGEILEMIKRSKIQIEKQRTNYINKFNEMKKNYEKVDASLKDLTNFKIDSFGGNSNILQDDKKIYREKRSMIKAKIEMVAENNDIYNLESKLNELLIIAEQINFYININEIPNIIEACKPNLDKELQRRIIFKHSYSKIMDTVDSMITEEFERRKKFFKENCTMNSKLKMQKKLIEILNQIFDTEEQKYKEKLDSALEKNDNTIFDNDIIQALKDLDEKLKTLFKELYKKKKSGTSSKIICESINLNDNSNKFTQELEEIKQNLSGIPEKNQNTVINIIENKILKNLNLSTNDLSKNGSENQEIGSNNNMASSIVFQQDDKNKKEIGLEISKKMAEKYSKYIWFYYKIFQYLKIFYNQSGKKYESELNENDPFTLHQFLVEILNENKMLTDKLKQVKELITKLK